MTTHRNDPKIKPAPELKPVEHQLGAQEAQKSVPAALLAVSVAVALFGSLLFNLLLRRQDTTLAFDSAHYFGSVQLLYDFLGGKATAQEGAELSQYLAIDGPVLPLLGSLAYVISGKAPSANYLQPLIVLQSVMHALSTAAVFVLSWRATNNRAWTTLAALAFATGAGILAAGRFLTESFAAAALLALAVQLCTPQRCGFKWLIGVGALNGLVLLLRPALAPAVLLADLVAFAWQPPARNVLWQRIVLWIAGLTMGAALTLAPSVVLNFCAAHKFSCVPERLPGWNIALGSDIETDGWSAIPVPALLDQNYFDKPMSIIYGVYKNHPHEFLGLSVRKAVRLFCSPWNDFKQTFLTMTPVFQLMAHRLILLLALAGGALALIQSAASRRRFASTSLLCTTTALSIAAAHLIFVPFEAIPRYAYSSVPFLLVLSAFFLTALFSRQQDRAKNLRWSVCLAPAVLVPLSTVNLLPFTIQVCNENLIWARLLSVFLQVSLFTAFSAGALLWAKTWSADREGSRMVNVLGFLTLAAAGIFGWALITNRNSIDEWQAKLTPHAQLRRAVLVDIEKRAPHLKPAWAALLVDGDQDLTAAEFSVNGKALRGKLLSIYDIPHPYVYQRTLLHTIDMQADSEGGGRTKLRQWRLINVPLEYVNRTGWNELVVSGEKGTIYGQFTDPLENRRYLPELQSFALCKLQSSLLDGDARPKDRIGVPKQQEKCCKLEATGKVCADLSGEPGRQTGQYRIHLLVGYNKTGKLHGLCCAEQMTFDLPHITIF